MLIRLAAMAAMVPVDDHSFYEIMLGGDDFMLPGFRLHQNFTDLGQLMHHDILTSSGIFKRDDVYQAIGKWINCPLGTSIIARMGFRQQNYLKSLFGQATMDS